LTTPDHLLNFLGHTRFGAVEWRPDQ
jgi:hypothetical protein